MLTIKGLRAAYGAVRVLHGIDLSVGQGELVTVIGANGAGKTTLLRTISGLVHAQAGTIEFDGRDLLSMSPDAIVKAGVVHVPEGRMVLNRMTVLENLRLGAFVRSDGAEIEKDLRGVLETFPRLRERLSQYAGTLSGGEQQMLAIGRGLMGKPRLLMLDEPSLGVAPIVVDALYEAIEAVRRNGVTILLVEQNAQRALAVASRAYALELGTISFSGSGQDLLNDDRVRQAYLGV